MTLAVATAPTTRRVRKGWRGAQFAGDFPTLGWGVLAWTYRYLPSPELDPDTTEFLNRRAIIEEAKGWARPLGRARSGWPSLPVLSASMAGMPTASL